MNAPALDGTTKALVPYRPTPLLLLQERIARHIAFHETRLALLRRQEVFATRWDLEDRIWDVTKPK